MYLFRPFKEYWNRAEQKSLFPKASICSNVSRKSQRFLLEQYKFSSRKYMNQLRLKFVWNIYFDVFMLCSTKHLFYVLLTCIEFFHYFLFKKYFKGIIVFMPCVLTFGDGFLSSRISWHCIKWQKWTARKTTLIIIQSFWCLILYPLSLSFTLRSIIENCVALFGLRNSLVCKIPFVEIHGV